MKKTTLLFFVIAGLLSGNAMAQDVGPGEAALMSIKNGVQNATPPTSTAPAPVVCCSATSEPDGCTFQSSQCPDAPSS